MAHCPPSPCHALIGYSCVSMPTTIPSVLVLGGGPDAEREVSLRSSKGVADALASRGVSVHYQIIDRVTGPELGCMPGEVIFPVLHGGFGEGGPLQEILTLDSRPFVGCTADAARLAMDKMATKLLACTLGIPTAPACVLNPADTGLHAPMQPPVVLKPIHDGSSVGLHICPTAQRLAEGYALVRQDQMAQPARLYMIERMIEGARELTVPILDGKALAPIEIIPADGVYDYNAKYLRGDTQYKVDPLLPEDVSTRIQSHAASLFQAMGCRHLARIDFMLAPNGVAYLLEVNTMPGFTGTSLLPKSAAHSGIDYASLCIRLVELAVRDGA